MEIQTEYWAKPIPTRDFDWCAFRDPEGVCGYGKDKDAAVNDLLAQEAEAE